MCFYVINSDDSRAKCISVRQMDTLLTDGSTVHVSASVEFASLCRSSSSLFVARLYSPVSSFPRVYQAFRTWCLLACVTHLLPPWPVFVSKFVVCQASWLCVEFGRFLHGFLHMSTALSTPMDGLYTAIEFATLCRPAISSPKVCRLFSHLVLACVTRLLPLWLPWSFMPAMCFPNFPGFFFHR